MAEIECVRQIGNRFGESLVWSASEAALYWVDVTAPAIHRLHALGPLWVRTRRGASACFISALGPNLRFNDGKCDRAGRFWSGTMDDVDFVPVATGGTYWCVLMRGGQIAQYDPAGRLMRTIKLPVKYPLMCTFGGADMETLYVTTSRALVSESEAAEQQLAGALFAIHGTGSRGIPEPLYVG